MSKKNYLLSIAFLLIVFCVACTSFALFTYSRTGLTKTTVVSGDIQFSFIDKDSVLIQDAFPLADSIGASDNKAYEFDVALASSSNSVSAIYSVSLVSNNSSGEVFNNDQIKYNLEKNGNYIIGSSNKGDLISSINGFNTGTPNGIGTILTNQKITAGQTDTYKLRIWIADDVNYSNLINSDGTMIGKYNSKTYSLRVKVESQANYNRVLKYDAIPVTYDATTIYICPAGLSATGEITESTICSDSKSVEKTYVSPDKSTSSQPSTCNCSVTSLSNYGNLYNYVNGQWTQTSNKGYLTGSCSNGATCGNSIYGMKIGDTCSYSCTVDVDTYSCPEGYSTSGTGSATECYKYQCPSDYTTEDEITETTMCNKSSNSVVDSYTCPDGGNISSDNKTCTYYTCPNGGTLNTSNNICEFN